MLRPTTLTLLLLTAVASAQTQEGTNPQPIELKSIPADPARLITNDEIDTLAAQLKPAARFANYKPNWRVETRDFLFEHYNRQESKTYTLVLDGDKVVALLRSGDILLIPRTPDTASTKINMPSERLHLDNLPGPSLPTHQFIRNVKTHGSIYTETEQKQLPREHWEKGPASLTFVRAQSLPEYTVSARFTFTVDPIFGYRIDAIRDVDFTNKPTAKDSMGGGAFTPGCYVPWPHAAIYERTAWTPISGNIEGWANNLLNMDRCDGGSKSGFAWRDGGFISYLPARDGWSVAFTRKDGLGDTPNLSVCNAHNDFHIKFLLKDISQVGDKYQLRATHRLLNLPPEITSHIWDNMKQMSVGQTNPIIRLGQLEDFEDQPLPLDKGIRGLVWTSDAPPIIDGTAHSGKKSMLIKGRAWPNLPQVSLKPNTRYKIEAWFKVSPWTPEQLEEAKKKDAARRADLLKKGKELPPEINWSNLTPKAWIQGDYYEWSPYTDKMLETLKTNEVTVSSGGADWQKVSLEFTSPKWGPFINLAFHCDNGTALLDDFTFTEVK